ncbi:unnamed protein product [Nippostrongylus brasiliensis]|uniref:Protein kinase domain-containing protein n=1 Tax=Nippostrongylus brasiliensis TaxID=27835 RepID=A0A0N4YGY9_NIPBR|nr:unnamed protein product [Nippostrongylus brasiliensis]
MEFVASLLNDGFGAGQIVQKRKMYRESGTHDPLYYISTADIRSIAIRRKLDVSRKDKNDLTSVEMRVTENNSEDGFQKCIPPIKDTADGFLLGSVA